MSKKKKRVDVATLDEVKAFVRDLKFDLLSLTDLADEGYATAKADGVHPALLADLYADVAYDPYLVTDRVLMLLDYLSHGSGILAKLPTLNPRRLARQWRAVRGLQVLVEISTRYVSIFPASNGATDPELNSRHTEQMFYLRALLCRARVGVNLESLSRWREAEAVAYPILDVFHAPALLADDDDMWAYRFQYLDLPTRGELTERREDIRRSLALIAACRPRRWRWRW